MTTPAFTLLIPVKDARDAKTRLGAVGDERRMSLMAAFARDAITAAQATSMAEVYVVGDPRASIGLSVPILPDEGDGDLNRALATAAARINRPGVGTAALLADLPCLRTADLEAALRAASDQGGRSFVADADGTGTTLLVATAGTELNPCFGAGSAAAHLGSGAHRITGDLTSLRLDVDTTDDLAAALRFGVGPYTARATADLA